MIKTPTFPGIQTLAARALMRLVTGKKITHRDFQNETATYRLSGYIEQLRNRHGWLITTQDEIAITSDPVKRMAKYGRYSIEPEILLEYRQVLGERLDKFIEAVKKIEGGHPQAANLGGGNK
jgi:hypothetical protein